MADGNTRIEDFDDAVMLARRVLEVMHRDHADRPQRLRELAGLLDAEDIVTPPYILDEVIQLKHEAFELTPTSQKQASQLSDIASLNERHYLMSSSISHLEEAIKLERRAADIATDEQDRAIRLKYLGQMFCHRYRRKFMTALIEGGIQAGKQQMDTTICDPDPELLALAFLDLEEAIEMSKRAIDMVPEDYANRSSWLLDIGDLYNDRYSHTKAMKDLENAINITRQSLETHELPNPEVIGSLGRLLGARYMRGGNICDIEEGCSLLKKALGEAASNDRFAASYNFTTALFQMYKGVGGVHHLDQAIEVGRQTAVTTRRNLPQVQVSYLLKEMFLERYQHTKSLRDLDKAIEMQRIVADIMYFDMHNKGVRFAPGAVRALLEDWWYETVGAPAKLPDLIEAMRQPAGVPIGGTTQVVSLKNLAQILDERYLKMGKMEGLVEVVQIRRTIVGLMPKPSLLVELGFRLLELYEETEDHTYADEATKISRQLGSGEEHYDDLPRHTYLAYLINELSVRFLISGDARNLENALQLGMQAIEMQSENDENHASAFSRIGMPLYLKFCTTRAHADLEIVLKNSDQATTATRESTLSQGHRLSRHSRNLLLRYRFTNSVVDLDNAIRIGRQAVDVSLEALHLQKVILDRLAATLYQRYLITKSVADLEEAIQLARRTVDKDLKDPISSCRYFINLASLLCERHEITESLHDLEEALDLTSVVQNSLEPREVPNPNLARILCYLPSEAFVHYLAGPHDNTAAVVQKYRDKVQVSSGNKDRALNLSGLVLALSGSVLSEEPLADLDEPVRIGRRAIDMARTSDPESLQWHLSCLAIALIGRFKRTNMAKDLAESISLGRQAMETAPENHPGRPFYIIVFAIGLSFRYYRTGRLSDLHECISLGLRAWRLSCLGNTIEDHYNQFWCSGNLAGWFGHRYLREGLASDLDQATEFRRHAETCLTILKEGEDADFVHLHLGTTNSAPPSDATRSETLHVTIDDISDFPARLYGLAVHLYEHCSETGIEATPSSAIFLSQVSVDSTPRGHLERPKYLELLGKCLHTRYSKVIDASEVRNPEKASIEKAAKDLDNATSALQEVIDVASSRTPVWYDAMHRLGLLYDERYRRSGDLGDLKMALVVLQESVQATPTHHPLRASRLRLLGGAKKNSYNIFNKIDDLEDAKRLFQEAVDITPGDCTSHVRHITDLASIYHVEFEKLKNDKYLEKAIQKYEDALQNWPLQHDSTHHRAQLSQLLGNLGQAYLEKYKITKAESDFDKSAEATQKAVENSSKEHPEWADWVVALANTHLTAYTFTHRTTYLQTTNGLLQEATMAAIKMLPRADPGWIEVMHTIGDCHRRKYDVTKLKADLEAALQCLHKSFILFPTNTKGNIVKMIGIGRTLASALIEVGDLDEAYCAIDKAVSMIALTIPRFLDISESQACLSKYSSLASDGASLALSAGIGVLDAIQVLEAGRAVATVAMNELRVNLSSTALLSAEEESELLQLCDELEPSSSTSSTGSVGSDEFPKLQPHEGGENDGVDTCIIRKTARRLVASERLDKFIHEYQSHRRQTAFPSEIDGGMLDQVTVDGHVVVVNVSYRCDAFLIKGYVPETIPLPKLSRQAIQDKVQNGSLTSLEVLEWLWETIASPVLDALGYTKPPREGDPWPRIWWIPTGPLSKFPLHAAGRHLEGSHESVMDRVISSYSTSIRALWECRKFIHVKSKMAEAQPETPATALMVAMDQTPGSEPLHNAGDEVTVVSEVFERMSIQAIQPDQRTTQAVLSLLRDCEFFHFAGHGYTDANDPSRSHLRLQDWVTNPLTVTDIVALNLRERMPFLAYLSACGTGQIEEARHLDESIHLISACQLAGFRHVIGTLCAVNDKICVDVARFTYEGIRNGGMSEESVCQGLHNAVRKLRDRWRDSLARSANSRTMNIAIRRVEIPLSATEENGDVDRLSRNVIACSEGDDEAHAIPLLWAPYVHYGC